jgi:hypothetical protein
MNGIEFYGFLRNNYFQHGQSLYGNFTFCDWLYKSQNGMFSFRFNINNNRPKAIPQDIIIAAWNSGQQIDDNWIMDNFGIRFHNDCRLRILNYLIFTHENLR